MEEKISDNKRIAKNAMYMYFRMGISMLVSLYTSRIILLNLGLVNYGIYNVVGSFIVAFTFIQGPIAAAIQRFLNYELGSKNGNVNAIMNQSLIIYSVLVTALFFIIEVAGTWYINNKMVVPIERLSATHFAFQMSLVSLVFSIMRSPYEALIIAHERMSYYAYVSILDVVLKLANAFSLAYISVDKLMLFSANQLFITIIIALAMFMFCRRNFYSEIILCRVRDWKQFKEILSFSGWSLFSGVASMTATHGINILLNAFFGVVVNAAMGVANQVNAAVYQFVSNFQKAFNPQIVKLYASGDLSQMCVLVSRASKFSYLLLFMIVCPIIFNLDYLLKLWLSSPPEGTGVFCIYLMIWQLLESLMAPMWTAVNATGNIKKYHLTMNPIILSVIVLSYVAFLLGLPAYTAIVIKCVIDVVLLCVRALFVRNMIGFSIKQYLFETIAPISTITLLGVCFMYAVSIFLDGNMLRLVLGTALFLIVYAVLVYILGLKKSERHRITNYLMLKFKQ